jgi:hypothetical protein
MAGDAIVLRNGVYVSTHDCDFQRDFERDIVHGKGAGSVPAETSALQLEYLYDEYRAPVPVYDELDPCPQARSQGYLEGAYWAVKDRGEDYRHSVIDALRNPNLKAFLLTHAKFDPEHGHFLFGPN